MIEVIPLALSSGITENAFSSANAPIAIMLALVILGISNWLPLKGQ